MVRSVESVKERIACNEFLGRLSPDLVPQSIDQGNDFGTDYILKQFDEQGVYVRRFNVQVKYISPSDIGFASDFDAFPWEWHFQGLPPDDLFLICRHDLSLEHLHRYLDPKISGGTPTLYFLGNEQAVFCCWVNDLYDFYLRWLPRVRRARGTVRVLFHNARSRGRQGYNEGNTCEQVAMPRNRDYSKFNDTLTMHAVAPSTRFLDRFFQPGNTDSLCNLGISMFLQNTVSGSRMISDFDVGGFWDHLVEVSVGKPWVFTLLARFIGLLPPIHAMSSWAAQTVLDWNSPYHIPAAFQILSQERSLKLVEQPLMNVWSRILNRRWSSDFFKLMTQDMGSGGSWFARHRVNAEFCIALSRFLEQQISVCQNPVAQEALITCFIDHDDPPDDVPYFAKELRSLAKNERFIPDDKRDSLLRYCGIGNSSPDEIQAAIQRAYESEVAEYWRGK